MASASDHGVLKLWDVLSGTVKRVYHSHADRINDVRYFENGAKLITISDDKTIKVWDSHTMQVVMTMTGHSAEVTALTFSEDENRILTGDDSGDIIVWDANSLREVFRYSTTLKHIHDIDVSRDLSRIVLSCYDGVFVLELRNHSKSSLLQCSFPHINDLKFSPNGEKLFVSSGERIITAIDCASYKQDWTVSYPGKPEDVFYDDFSELSVSQNDSTLITNLDNKIITLNYNTGHETRAIDYDAWVFSVSLSPNEHYLAVAASNGTTMVNWDKDKSETMYAVYGLWYIRGNVFAFSPSSKEFSLHDREWNTETGKENTVYAKSTFRRSYDSSLKKNAYSPNGRMLFSSNGSSYAIRNTSTGEIIRKIPLHWGWSSDKRVDFSPDNKLFICGAGPAVQVWDIETGILICSMSSLQETIHDVVSQVVFSPAGDRIACCTESGKILIWSYPSLQELLNTTTNRFINVPLTESEIDYYVLGKQPTAI